MSNSTPKRRFFSGTSLERAVLEASGFFGLEPEELDYTRLEKSGVGARGKVVIKVDPSSPAKAAKAPAAEPGSDDATPQRGSASAETPSADEVVAKQEQQVEFSSDDEQDSDEAQASDDEEDIEEEASEAAGGSEDDADEDDDDDADDDDADDSDDAGEADEAEASAPLGGEMADLPRTSAEARREWKQASGPVEQAARKWIESLLRVASLDLGVEIYERGGELEVHLGGADAEVAVEDGGEVLRAIQHLLPRLMLGTVGESVPCRVDCNDFRELHEERLRAQALTAAAEATSDGSEVTLDPMHPADRRIVHMTLADNDLVRTESLGRGFFKRVSIRSA